uniref:protein-S-isoprenylcysteine alpha-carbonyl methylesterase n=1 Tax=Aegilops tauschii subsp. strangulata TaxID=200361 RepID=A0A453F498_AEGTS
WRSKEANEDLRHVAALAPPPPRVPPRHALALPARLLLLLFRRSPPPRSILPHQLESPTPNRPADLPEPSPRNGNAASRLRGRRARGGRAPPAERLRRPPPLVARAVRVPEAPGLGRPQEAVVLPRRRRPCRLRDLPRHAPHLHPAPVPRVRLPLDERQLVALAVYAILLMPGFLQVGYYYFFSSQVHRSIVYGEQPRNRLDLYIPKDNRRPCPVVAFVTGGAWIIGYKAWGALLGRRLAERGIIVACIDYRNFPQGRIGDMVSDASQGISFVCNNIASYGGDPNKIYLMGQSAGAHISACALMEQAVKESSGQPISWSVTQIKAYFGLSGGYNIHNLVDHFHQRGLNRSIFLSIMDGEESLSRYSPEIVVKESSARTIALLPHIFLMHGTDDYSIPSSARKSFYYASPSAFQFTKTNFPWHLSLGIFCS